MESLKAIDRTRLQAVMQQEQQRFAAQHRLSQELFQRARQTLLGGVPMNWMAKWAGGFPVFVEKATEEVARRIAERISLEDCDTGGIGGTLAGNALSLAAMRATLEHVLTDAAFTRMVPLAERFTRGVEDVIREFNMPWCVTRLGCRAEYRFTPMPPRNGSEAVAAGDFELERFLHLYALNRGILLTPFHNMALMSPATSEADADLHAHVFRESVAALVA